MPMPSLFISHGAPSLLIDDVPARRFLLELGAQLPRPRAILVASAHWETPAPMVNAVVRNDTIHDFGGFPEALYQATYPAPGAPALAAQVAEQLIAAGSTCGVDTVRGLDHGAWVPLALMYPAHDIPVVQLSVQPALGADHHYQIGRILVDLRRDNVLVIGSGSLTHNLRELDWTGANTQPEWSRSFAEWMDAALGEGRIDDALAYRRLAPQARRNHPTPEHLMPLYVALGAGYSDEGPGAVRRLHASHCFGSLRMDAYAFG